MFNNREIVSVQRKLMNQIYCLGLWMEICEFSLAFFERTVVAQTPIVIQVQFFIVINFKNFKQNFSKPIIEKDGDTTFISS